MIIITYLKVIIFPDIIRLNLKCCCFLWSCLSNRKQQHEQTVPASCFFFPYPVLYQLVLTDSSPHPSNIFQNLFNQLELQKAAKWEQPGWKVQEAGLCSHLAWCQTGVLLGVALINSSLLFLLVFIPRSAAQMGSGLRTISYRSSEIVSIFNLPKFFCPFQLQLTALLWTFLFWMIIWWRSSFRMMLVMCMKCKLKVTIQFPGSHLTLNP